MSGLAPQSRMQFHNTSDTVMRTEADKQDYSGELHAKLLEESQDGEVALHEGPTHRGHVTRGLHVAQATHQYGDQTHNTPVIATARQKSHVIQLPEHSTTFRNVAIPTITIQSLKQPQGNYVRNWRPARTAPETAEFPQHAGTQIRRDADTPRGRPLGRPLGVSHQHSASCPRRLLNNVSSALLGLDPCRIPL